jgi:hypothetical protein
MSECLKLNDQSSSFVHQIQTLVVLNLRETLTPTCRAYVPSVMSLWITDQLDWPSREEDDRCSEVKVRTYRPQCGSEDHGASMCAVCSTIVGQLSQDTVMDSKL